LVIGNCGFYRTALRLALIIALTLGVVGPPLSAQAHEPRAKRILEGPEYRGYRVERAQPVPGDASSGNGGGRDARDDGSARRTSDAGPARRPRQGSGGDGGSSGNISAPAWIGTMFEVVVWVLLIAGAAVALFFIVKALLGIHFKRRPKAEKKKVERRKSASTGDAPAAPEASTAILEDALAAAQRELEAALRNGDWAKAALLAYRIFWLKAGWRGCVEQSDVRTWRDAVRMVRAAELRSRVRELLALVERVRYGEHAPARAEFEEWKARLDQLEPTEVLR
jgi:hypothetical protein